ncbi:MAG: transaldolase family protein [Chloroflexota bacterium]
MSPHLAHDTDGTIAEARRLFRQVGRRNLMIKVPGNTGRYSGRSPAHQRRD